jgi:hypothetical protein
MLKGRNHLKNVSLSRRIILKLIMNKQNVRMSNGFIWLGIRLVAGCCEHYNEVSGPIKGAEYIYQLMGHYTLKKALLHGELITDVSKLSVYCAVRICRLLTLPKERDRLAFQTCYTRGRQPAAREPHAALWM